MTEARTIAGIMGEALRAKRATARQEDIAAQARSQGLNWRRSTVAAVEAGTREISREEEALLSQAFGWRPENWLLAGAAFEDLEEPVRLSSTATVTRRALIEWHATDRPRRSEKDYGIDGYWKDARGWETPSTRVSRQMSLRIAELIEEARALWPRITKRGVMAALHESQGEAESKAGQRLRLSAFEVTVLAWSKWGHGLTTERDRRVAEQAPQEASPRTLQARRGHVTRALIADLEAIAPKRRKKA